MFQGQPDQAGAVGVILDQRPPLPQNEGDGLGISLPSGQPVGIVAEIAGPVEGIAGEGVQGGKRHDRLHSLKRLLGGGVLILAA